jgi:DNA-binding LacI/PurR family transcriptional regulator
MTTLAQEMLVSREVGKGTHVLETQLVQHVGLLLPGNIFSPHASTFAFTAIRHVIGHLTENQMTYRIYLTDIRDDGSSPLPAVGVDFLNAAEKDKFSGVLVIGMGPDPQWGRVVKKNNVPTVGISGGEYEYRIGTDIAPLIRRAVQHLVGHGRRKLAFMGWNQGAADRFGRSAPNVQLETFKDACQKAGVKLHEKWIEPYIQPGHPGQGWEAFRAIWSAKRKTRPDGLVVADDLVFNDACIAISNMGIKVPDELMIVTHSNRYSGLVAPFPVARMENDPALSAEYAWQMLSTLMKGQEPKQKMILVPQTWRDEMLLSPQALKIENEQETIADVV